MYSCALRVERPLVLPLYKGWRYNKGLNIDLSTHAARKACSALLLW